MTRKTVAWIEDDIDTLGSLVTPLRRAGIAILEYRTYSEAKAAVDVLRTCDVIIVDAIIPSGTLSVEGQHLGEHLGIQLLEELRAESNMNVPAIILSVVANEVVDDEKLRRLNAIALTKPIRPSELKEAVARILHTSL